MDIKTRAMGMVQLIKMAKAYKQDQETVEEFIKLYSPHAEFSLEIIREVANALEADG